MICWIACIVLSIDFDCDDKKKKEFDLFCIHVHMKCVVIHASYTCNLLWFPSLNVSQLGGCVIFGR